MRRRRNMLCAFKSLSRNPSLHLHVVAVPTILSERKKRGKRKEKQKGFTFLGLFGFVGRSVV